MNNNYCTVHTSIWKASTELGVLVDTLADADTPDVHLDFFSNQIVLRSGDTTTCIYAVPEADPIMNACTVFKNLSKRCHSKLSKSENNMIIIAKGEQLS